MPRTYLKKSYDVVVIGGGMAGCCAAIAAARHGASVGFIQDRPVLGGNASSEIRVPISGATWGGTPPINRHARETGIIDEIWIDYCVRDPNRCHSLRDLILLEHVDAEKNIDLYLNYRACDVVMKDAGTIAAGADAIYRELIAVVMGIWDHIKNSNKHEAENLALEWIGKVPGRRESRRFMGDHIMRQSDVEDRVLFEDRVAYGGWWLDQHPPGGIYDEQPPCDKPPFHGIYSIPMRSLYSRNVNNLLFAGRHISTTHVAHSSTRVMRTLSVIGQASGTAAALCVRRGSLPAEVANNHVAELQQQLVRDDAYIIGLPNQDPDDLARTGRASATSEWKPSAEEAEAFCHSDFSAGNVLSGIARPEKDVSSNLWVSDPGAGLPQALTVELPEAAEVGQIGVRFDTRLDDLYFDRPVEECARDYVIELRAEKKWREVHTEKGNYHRQRVHNIEPLRADAVRISVQATNGAPTARIYQVRVYPPGR